MKGIVAVSHDVLEKLSRDERELLRHRFHDPIMKKFFDLQAEEALKQLAALDPTDITDAKANDYVMQAKSLKMIEFFWKQLSEFCTTFARSV